MSVQRSPLYLLAIAQTLSLTGTRVTMVAIPWMVLNLTGDPFLTGAAAFSEMLPYVVAKALSGPLIDRFGAQRISIGADIFAACIAALIPALYLWATLNIWLLLPVIALIGIARGPADAAKHALIPVVAEAGNLPLERVSGIIGTIDRLSTVLGAALAGAMVAGIGAAPALGITASAFTLAALVMSFTRLALPIDRTDASAMPASYFADLREGWAFLRLSPVLLGIVIMVACSNFLDQAMMSVFMPVWTEQHSFGPEVLSLLFIAFSASAIVGSLIASALGEKMPRLALYTICYLITGLPRYAAFALGIPLNPLLVVLVISGFAAGFINPILSAVIFENIPRQLTGRVSALFTALCWVLMPFGGLAAGISIKTMGLAPSLLGAGLLYLLVTMLPLTRKSFREFSSSAAMRQVTAT